MDPRPTLQLEGLVQLKKYINLVRNGTSDLSACSVVPQPTTQNCTNVNNCLGFILKRMISIGGQVNRKVLKKNCGTQ
jgi:hypothetical protein